MIPILLAGGRVLVEGSQIGRVVMVVPHACKPLRPLIPIVYGHDFDLVGLERRLGREGEIRKLWPDDAYAPASLFNDSLSPLFRLDLPSFLRNDELILVVRNQNAGPRQFACGWLVEDERRS